jgi:hypothetical protein
MVMIVDKDEKSEEKMEKAETKNENLIKIESSPMHALQNREFEKATWTRKVLDDDSRLPSMYHILFAVLDATEQPLFLGAIKKAGQKARVVEGLGGFAICDSEAKAEALFKELTPRLLVYPLKEVPRAIRNDQLRSEICFMEGVRPQKTTSVANRLIYKHLGFK